MNKKIIFIALLLFVSFFLIFKTANKNKSEQEPYKGIIELYKTRTCDCCTEYAEYLIKNGYKVKIKVVSDFELEKLKDKLGIPKSLRSCHTSLIDNKIIEGHVPIEVIEKFLDTSWKGLSLPGMPIGSPGMSGPKLEEFVFYVFNESSKKEFIKM